MLDIGTGSGCLAVTLAVKCPEAQIRALDISQKALEMAEANARRHGVADRIVFQRSNLLEGLESWERFDLVVSNPPYISTDCLESLQPEVKDFDPRPALDGGIDGLEFYQRLGRNLATYMSAEGTLMVEFGDDQQEAVAAIFRGEGWRVQELVADLAGKPRIMIARAPLC